ncbi:hypothetical protein ONZ45_g2108 [Pleurotus djamor]|nr:hypothetical protein ONZ45_g2108 [Pleurotus djamor]
MWATLTFVSWQANVPSPIQRIPVELLLAIFAECLPNVSFTKPSVSDAPMLLTHVCASWRTIVLETPQMWSSLGVNMLERKPTPLPMVEWWLERVKDRPFDFSFRLDQWPPVAGQLVRQATAVLGLLVGKMSSWRDVQLVLPGSYKLLNSIPTPGAANQLHSINVDLQDWKESEMDSLNRIFEGAPSLRKLTWSNRASWSSWDRSFDDFLCKMDISWGSLTHIVFDAWICLGDLLFILNQCHNLTLCDLRHFGGGYLPPNATKTEPPSRLVLPHLQTLSIYQLYLNSGLGSLLDSIQCPNLKNFSAICGFVDSAAWPQQQFLAFLENSSCSVDSLAFEYTGINEDELMECLTVTNKTLTQLRISDGRGKLVVTEKLLQALTYGQDHCLLLCPKLRVLCLDLLITAPEGRIAQMVLSRWGEVPSSKGIYPLSRLGIAGSHSPGRKADLDRLRELTKTGLQLCIM